MCTKAAHKLLRVRSAPIFGRVRPRFAKVG